VYPEDIDLLLFTADAMIALNLKCSEKGGDSGDATSFTYTVDNLLEMASRELIKVRQTSLGGRAPLEAGGEEERRRMMVYLSRQSTYDRLRCLLLNNQALVAIINDRIDEAYELLKKSVALAPAYEVSQ
jgi:hypothetical protein